MKLKNHSPKIPSKISRESGFTLVELAVVLFIIGLMIGAVLKAEEVYRIVQVRRVMSDINSVSAATKGFQEKYGSIPGDFPLALTRVPNCTAQYFCYAGNGDAKIGRIYSGASGWDRDQTRFITLPEVETTMFWKHLVLAGFLKGINPMGNPQDPSWTQTHPEAAIGGGYTVFTDTMTAGSSISIRLQNTLSYGPAPSTAARAIDGSNQRPFSVKQTQYMDTKYDDGRPGAGEMWAIPINVSDSCRIGGPGGDVYNIALGDNKSCQFHFVFH